MCKCKKNVARTRWLLRFFPNKPDYAIILSYVRHLQVMWLAIVHVMNVRVVYVWVPSGKWHCKFIPVCSCWYMGTFWFKFAKPVVSRYTYAQQDVFNCQSHYLLNALYCRVHFSIKPGIRPAVSATGRWRQLSHAVRRATAGSRQRPVNSKINWGPVT